MNGNYKVALVSYQRKDVANIWYSQWKVKRGTYATLVTLECFTSPFCESLFLIELK